MRTSLLFLLFCMFLTIPTFGNEWVGKRCPGFSYPDVEGNMVSLKDFKGKYVFIDIWGTWCMPCQHEVPYMQVLEEEFKEDHIVFVSIAHEKDKNGDNWRKQVRDMKGVQLLATDHSFVERLGIKKYPTFILIDPQGRIVSRDFQHRPSSPECRNDLLKLLRGVEGANLNQRVEVNPVIRKDTLSNGLTYYLARNNSSNGRVGFYLIRNAGALMESDAQNGLAHFLEHMAFNGTTNFPGTLLPDVLKRNGIRSFNAYTGQNETVYHIDNVPIRNKVLVDTCLLILRDWIDELTLDPEEVNAERGVIVEELRSRQDAVARLREQYLPVLYGNNSQYVKRNVGGSPEVIKTFPMKELRDFYHDWYRTDLTAVAVIGDIDLNEMETRIKQLFGDVPAVENPKPRPFYKIESPYNNKYVLATDPEIERTVIYQYRHTYQADNKDPYAYESVRRDLIEELTRGMLADRVKESSFEPNVPFFQGQLSNGKIERGFEAYVLSVLPKSTKEEGAALEYILTLNEQALRYGFTNSELERQKKNMLRSLDLAKGNQHLVPNQSIASEIQDNFLTGSAMLDLDSYYRAVQEIFPTISVADAWSVLKRWNRLSGEVVVITGSSNEEHLTEAEVVEIKKRVSQKELKPYEDVTSDETFLDESKLKGSLVINEVRRSDLKAVEWTLANGAKVVFSFSSVEPDDISLYAFSAGGNSLYEGDLLPASCEGVTFALRRFGLGDFTKEELERKNRGKTVIMTASVGELEESVSGASSITDFERLMQMVYLWFMEPRFDEGELQEILKMNRERLKTKGNDPSEIMADSLKLLESNYSLRVRFLSEEYLSLLTMDRIEKVVRERFGNVSDFTFCFSGNIPEKEMKALVEKYIGSIVSSDRRENWKDNGVRPPRGVVERNIWIPMQNKKATVVLEYHKAMDYTWEDNLKMEILSKVLGERLTRAIREKESATYAINNVGMGDYKPYGYFKFKMRFDCDPVRAKELREIVFREIECVRKEGISSDELKSVVYVMVENQQASRKPRQFYNLGNVLYLHRYYTTGINDADPENYENIVEKFSVEDIRNFANRFFDGADLLDVTFLPEEPVTVHEIGVDVPNENVLGEIISLFEGKMILLDSWGTWCSSCIYAMRDMKPLKKELNEAGIDYVYVYMADESSPLGKWQEMIKRIPGHHIRLTSQQFDYIRNIYKIPGAPGFLIINRKGEVVWHSVAGFPGVDELRKEMITAWEK